MNVQENQRQSYPIMRDGRNIYGTAFDPEAPHPPLDTVKKCGSPACGAIILTHIEYEWKPYNPQSPDKVQRELAASMFGIWVPTKIEERVIPDDFPELEKLFRSYDTTSCPRCGHYADAGYFKKK